MKWNLSFNYEYAEDTPLFWFNEPPTALVVRSVEFTEARESALIEDECVDLTKEQFEIAADLGVAINGLPSRSVAAAKSIVKAVRMAHKFGTKDVSCLAAPAWSFKLPASDCGLIGSDYWLPFPEDKQQRLETAFNTWLLACHHPDAEVFPVDDFTVNFKNMEINICSETRFVRRSPPASSPLEPRVLPWIDLMCSLNRAVWLSNDAPSECVGPGGFAQHQRFCMTENGKLVFVSPEYVEPSVRQLAKFIRTQVDLSSSGTQLVQKHPLVAAAIIHHTFLRIHPFTDGNGRTARALTNAFLLRKVVRPSNCSE